MAGRLATSFLINRLFRRFGPFHWLAVAGAATRLGVLVLAVLRRPRQTSGKRH